jgi:hypothetical protein
MTGPVPSERVDEIVRLVQERAAAHDHDGAWAAAGPLLAAHGHQPAAARAAALLLRERAFDQERGIEVASALFEAHRDDVAIASAIGEAFEALHEVDFLNAAPPDHPLFTAVATRLRDLAAATSDRDQQTCASRGLATASRILGRSWDAVAEPAYRRVVEANPDAWESHYDLGLFYKTRGRFADGQAANQRALDLGGAEDCVLWNLGICATGARDVETALRVWRQLGQEIAQGRYGLPDGIYHPVKVRLAQRPLAEREPGTRPDDPGCEETIWVERLSPCHGVVKSALYQDEVGVDYGDVILFDGAPITHHNHDGRQVPVFPHLSTLERPGYRIFRFAGTQQHAGQIASLSDALPDEAVLYVHTEQFTWLCASCWRDRDLDHAEHDRVERHIVTGKVCAPPTVSAADLLRAMDWLLDSNQELRILSPRLCEAAGDLDRADVERRRVAMIGDRARS